MSGHYFSPYVEWLATTLQDMLTPILCGFFYKVVYTQALAEVDRIHKNSTNPNGRKLETCSQEFDEVFYPQALLPLLEQVKNGAPCFDSIIQDIHNSIERQYRQLLPMLKEIYGVTVNEFLIYKRLPPSIADTQSVTLNFTHFLKTCLHFAAADFKKCPSLLDVRCSITLQGERRLRAEERIELAIQRALRCLLPIETLVRDFKTVWSLALAAAPSSVPNAAQAQYRQSYQQAQQQPAQYEQLAQHTQLPFTPSVPLNTAAGLLSDLDSEQENVRQQLLPRKLPVSTNNSSNSAANSASAALIEQQNQLFQDLKVQLQKTQSQREEFKQQWDRDTLERDQAHRRELEHQREELNRQFEARIAALAAARAPANPSNNTASAYDNSWRSTAYGSSNITNSSNPDNSTASAYENSTAASSNPENSWRSTASASMPVNESSSGSLAESNSKRSSLDVSFIDFSEFGRPAPNQGETKSGVEPLSKHNLNTIIDEDDPYSFESIDDKDAPTVMKSPNSSTEDATSTTAENRKQEEGNSSVLDSERSTNPSGTIDASNSHSSMSSNNIGDDKHGEQ